MNGSPDENESPAGEGYLSLVRRLWKRTDRRRQLQFALLLVMMIVTSFAEVLSIGAVIPFLGALTAPDFIFSHPFAAPILDRFDMTAPDQLLLPLTALFCLAALLAGGMRLILLWLNIRLSFAVGIDLSIDIYRRTLFQPYSVHVSRNSSEVIDVIATKTSRVTFSIILPILNLLSAGAMLVVIMTAFLIVEPLVAVVCFGSISLVYGVVVWLVRNRLLSDSERVANASTEVIQSLQEGLGGIRDVLIDNTQLVYVNAYREADRTLRRAQGNNTFITTGPRHVIEALGMVLIALFAYYLAVQPGGIATAIPVLGAVGLVAQRLLPVLQQLYGSWSSIQGAYGSLQDTLELLEQPMPVETFEEIMEPLPFENKLDRLSFRYNENDPWVFENLDLDIPKGGKVGFVGVTGTGKSTLLDVVMGLLPPTEGTMTVDGQLVTRENQRAWQRHIAHVPQSLFLSDGTVEENIAFSASTAVDRERVRRCAEEAKIASTIESWPQQYQTIVGERGVRLSGGQRQRIGIARALYRKADVIVLDEATSALDEETEAAVMGAIDSLSDDVTVLIIAHRMSTLRICSQIVKFGDGKFIRSGTFEDVLSTGKR